MGGLIVKQLLVDSAAAKNSNSSQNGDDLVANCSAIVFLSTPHLGSDLARSAVKFSFALFPSTEITELAANNTYLLDLNKRYVNHLQKLKLKSSLFFFC